MTLRASRRAEFIRTARPLRASSSQTAAPRARGGSHKEVLIHTSLQVGKYLVSPMTRPLDGGLHAAAVSIRSGRGSMTHDRVLRFAPVFDSDDQAARFATEQALAWIGRPAHDLDPSLHTTTD